MENFISTIVFLLPGFLMYFWVQSFGINPVVKHSATEMVAIAALLWLPVSLLTLLLHNGIGAVYGAQQIWTLEAVKVNSGRLEFLSWFTLLSIPVSFLTSFLYAKALHPLQKACINFVRSTLKMAPLSETPSVWEEFFVKIDEKRKQGAIPVKIYKLDKPEESAIGLIEKASRPFEPERALVLVRCKELSDAHKKYEYLGDKKYIDLKSGLVVEELDLERSAKETD